MSVTTELSQIKYAGRGDTGPYVITFPVTYNDLGNAEYIKVYVLDKATGEKTDITATSSINGLNVTTATVYDSNYEVQILRDPPFTQENDFTYGSSFPAALFNKALDKLTMLAIRLKESLFSSIQKDLIDDKYEDDGVTPVRMTLPLRQQRKNMALIFDEQGSVTVGTFPSPVATSYIAGIMNQENLVDAVEASGIQNIFQLGKNKIINGNFNFWQRGTSFSSVASGTYTADRFVVIYSTEAVTTVSQNTDVPTVEESGTNSTYSLKIAVTTADTSIGSIQQYSLRQIVEGYNARSFGFGKPGTRYVTLSFWHKFSKTGVYCVSFRNSNYSRSYVTEFTQSSANTWEKTVITIPVDTTGTWLYDSGAGIIVTFALAAGTNHHTSTPNTWQSGSYLATSNQVNGLDSTSNTFLFSQIQLEEGEIVTKLEERPYGLEKLLCERYFENAVAWGIYNGAAMGDTKYLPILYKVAKRGTPTVTNINIYYYQGGGVVGITGSSVSVGGEGCLVTGSFSNFNGWAYILAKVDAEL